MDSDRQIVEPLSDDAFAKASERALTAAVTLAAWCGGVSAESLKQTYLGTMGSKLAAEVSDEPLHEWEELDDGCKDEGETVPKCADVLRRVCDDAEDAAADTAPAENEVGEGTDLGWVLNGFDGFCLMTGRWE